MVHTNSPRPNEPSLICNKPSLRRWFLLRIFVMFLCVHLPASDILAVYPLYIGGWDRWVTAIRFHSI